MITPSRKTGTSRTEENKHLVEEDTYMVSTMGSLSRNLEEESPQLPSGLSLVSPWLGFHKFQGLPIPSVKGVVI